MHVSTVTKCISRLPAVFLFGLFLAHVLTSAQNPSAQSQSPTSKPVRHDSVGVVADLSPEEVEEGNQRCNPLSANIKARGLCQFPLAVVKGPKSLHIEFESAGDVQAVERADAEFGSIPSAEIGTYL